MWKKKHLNFSQAQSNSCFIPSYTKCFSFSKFYQLIRKIGSPRKKLIYMHTITTQQNNNGDFMPTSSRMPRPDVNENFWSNLIKWIFEKKEEEASFPLNYFIILKCKHCCCFWISIFRKYNYVLTYIMIEGTHLRCFYSKTTKHNGA